MNYGIKLFKGEVDDLGFDSIYNTRLVGAFYTLYTKEGDSNFYMSKSDEASFKERIYFYDHFLDKNNYPCFDEKAGLIYSDYSVTTLLSQFLGIHPLSLEIDESRKCTTTKEILDRIIFVDGLEESCYLNKSINENVLFTNDVSVKHAINNLIANGVFLLNPEKIYSADNHENVNYPIYFDFEKMPSYLLQEEEDATKLLMDFVANPHLITQKDFNEYFKPLDYMSLKEKSKLAFSHMNDLFDNAIQKELILALRRYFYALIRKILNEFYFKNYQRRGLCGFTVLDHDFEVKDYVGRFVYQGLFFDVYADDYRTFEFKDGKVIQKFKPDFRYFDIADKESLRRGFDIVKKFFDRNLQYGYMPALFLRMMGLPYAALKLFENYDFKNGDSSSFLNMIEFKEISYLKAGIVLSFLDKYGYQNSINNMNSYIPYLFRDLKKNGLFISDPNALFEIGNQFYLFNIGESKDSTLKKLITGDSKTYKDSFNKFIKYIDDTQPSSEKETISNIKRFLLNDEVNSTLMTIKKYFDLLSTSLSSFEAQVLLKEECRTSFNDISLLINLVFLYSFDKKLTNKIDKLSTNSKCESFCLSQISKGRYFYNPFLKYKTVIAGRNFLVYKDENGKLYMDEDDRISLFNLIDIYFYYYHRYFHYTLFAFGKEFIKYHEYDFDDDGLRDFLGLPKELIDTFDFNRDLKQQINFEKNISMYNDVRQRDMIKDDPTLNFYVVFSKMLEKGVLFLQRYGDAPFLYHKKNSFWVINSYLSDEMILDFSLKEGKELYEIKLSHLKRDKVCSLIRDIMTNKKITDIPNIDTKEYSSINNFALRYAGMFVTALYDSIYREAFDMTSGNMYVGYYKKDGLYIAPGTNFFAFSDNEELSSFGFLKEDAIKIASYINEGKKQGFIMLENEIHKLGVPDIFVPILMQSFKDKEEITIDDIPIYEGKKLPTFNGLYSRFGIFGLIRFEPNSAFQCIQIRHKAIENGMLIFADSDLTDDNLLNPNIVADAFKSLNSFRNNAVYLSDELNGNVEEFIRMDDVRFFAYIEILTDRLHRKVGYSSDFFFAVKEIMLYCYQNDRDFIKKIINDFSFMKTNSFNNDELKELFKKEISSYQWKTLQIVIYYICYMFICDAYVSLPEY